MEKKIYFGHEGISEYRKFKGNRQYKFDFPNGYGASVVIGPYTYGGDQGLYELAVLKDGEICYDTPITDNVIGYLDVSEVEGLLNQIKAL